MPLLHGPRQLSLFLQMLRLPANPLFQKRLQVLLERRLGETERYLRMAEIGYTRQGSNFGQASVGRECVVTGGAGTIAVTHNGQTYYVCCTGCRDYFNDDPEAVLAEYRAKKVAEKEQK